MSRRRLNGMTSLLAALMLPLIASTCAKQQTASPAESDSARVVRLEREARALAKPDGCGGSEQCRAAPVGDRPCGGPRDYVVYCARTTDTVALNAKLAELVAAEREYNRKSGMASTCEYRLPPQTGLVSGSCAPVPAR
jgi:hypothetical protein